MPKTSVFVAVALFVTAMAGTTSRKPHVVLLLHDDGGYNNIGYHNTNKTECRTPTLDALADSGIRLERFYAYKFCSPTRSSLQTGRLPVHVNDVNVEPEVRNPEDTVSGYQGIPVNMTGLATLMQRGGYRTFATGKWDAGMARSEQTPLGRGYEGWLGYFHHANDYYTQGIPLTAVGDVTVCLNRFKDLSYGDRPAIDLAGKGFYEEDIFLNHSLRVIAEHDADNASAPLFLFHAFHLVHTPLQVPQSALDAFAAIDNSKRQHVAAMTNYLDGEVAQLVDALKAKQMWDDTLFIYMSDNGGAIYGAAGGSNHPLRGGKMSDWEGGVRVNAFVSGGKNALPDTNGNRGRVADGPGAVVHAADWLATLAEVAGVDPTDHAAAAAGLPPIDSLSMWPFLTGGPTAKSPRTEVQLSQQALLSGRYKLVTGSQAMDGWVGPIYPNNTGPHPTYKPLGWEHDCGAGELYDVFADPFEHTNLASSEPAVLQQLQARLAALNQKYFNPNRGKPDKAACTAAQNNGGFYGPFADP